MDFERESVSLKLHDKSRGKVSRGVGAAALAKAEAELLLPLQLPDSCL